MAEAPAPVYACTLEDSELLARIQAWQRITRQATSRQVEETRIVATYPTDAQLLRELRALIDAEAECCSFLEFTVEEKADAVVTELRFLPDTPPAMRTLILDVLGTNQ
jgi:hypothetical protein